MGRYILQTSPNKFVGGGFRIWDTKENVEVCICGERRHVTLILDLLEQEENNSYIRSIP